MADIEVTEADIELAEKILEAASPDGAICCHDLEYTQKAVAGYRTAATEAARADVAELVGLLSELVEDDYIEYYLRADSAQRAKCKWCGKDEFFRSSIAHVQGCKVGLIETIIAKHGGTDEQA